MLNLRIPLTLSLVLFVSGCRADHHRPPYSGAESDIDAVERSIDATAGLVDDVAAPSPPPTGQFMAIEPGGDTVCARGGSYRFFVYGGDPNKVVIDFQGPWGGACWSALTCQVGAELLGQPIITDSVMSLEALKATHEAGELGGLYDFDNPDNPFFGWTIIQVPYCTGDHHWGDATVDYSEDLTIHHRGFVNTKAVIEWTKAHYPNPDEVVAAGSSVGGLGAIGHSPHISDTYPEANITVLVDSAVGIINDDFFATAFPKWNASASLPVDLIQRSDIVLEEITIIDFYVAVATNYPELRFAQYTGAQDQAQALYYLFMGGDRALWSIEAQDTLTQIRARAQNFRYYLAPGPIHGLHHTDILFERTVNGVPYTSWLREVIGGSNLPGDVICEAPCIDDPICADCLDESSESSHCFWCQDLPF